LRSDVVRSDVPLPAYPSSKKYLYNVSNSLSRTFYSDQGIDVAPAFEKQHPNTPLIMQCRYCIRYALGYCVKHGGSKPNWHEPLYLTLPNAKRFRLEFVCKVCKMNIYGE
jgi:putative protease